MVQLRARLDRPARTGTGGHPLTRATAGVVASATACGAMVSFLRHGGTPLATVLALFSATFLAMWLSLYPRAR